MLIKLDENLGERGREMLAGAGHEVATVSDQGLAGAADPRLIAVCAAERRLSCDPRPRFLEPVRLPA